jgi:hypothetical protein
MQHAHPARIPRQVRRTRPTLMPPA